MKILGNDNLNTEPMAKTKPGRRISLVTKNTNTYSMGLTIGLKL